MKITGPGVAMNTPDDGEDYSFQPTGAPTNHTVYGTGESSPVKSGATEPIWAFDGQAEEIEILKKEHEEAAIVYNQWGKRLNEATKEIEALKRKKRTREETIKTLEADIKKLQAVIQELKERLEACNK